MLDVGWSEILVIAIVMIIVVGPKDLPAMLRTFGAMSRKLRGMASDFQHQFNDALREAELDDVRKSIDDVRRLDPRNAVKEALNPLRKAGEDVKRELSKAGGDIAKAAGEKAPEPVKVTVPDPVVALDAAAPVIAAPESVTAEAPAPKPRKSRSKAS